ncbi:copper resistance protein CopC [Aliidiomarina halalkaliphila]|uniref:Copper resistance protein C n=1 Tax=Aliidiomarina halalkaliphila TaxID=2593535 RepID=A0A552X1F7_9GAMM|nr:copper resistance CopC family protein [Aliidiomarina halalkaliphila]TRW48881.1 copper resistance protein CopC [Aliidiomarina halalkaliphila]
MTLFPKMTLVFVLWFAGALMQSAQAHSQLVQSIPANGDRLTSSPSALHLQYNEEVRLLSVELVGNEHGEIDIDFRRARRANDHFRISVPELESDDYTITWTLIGEDGHRVSGTILFVLDRD